MTAIMAAAEGALTVWIPSPTWDLSSPEFNFDFLHISVLLYHSVLCKLHCLCTLMSIFFLMSYFVQMRYGNCENEYDIFLITIINADYPNLDVPYSPRVSTNRKM